MFRLLSVCIFMTSTGGHPHSTSSLSSHISIFRKLKISSLFLIFVFILVFICIFLSVFLYLCVCTIQGTEPTPSSLPLAVWFNVFGFEPPPCGVVPGHPGGHWRSWVSPSPPTTKNSHVPSPRWTEDRAPLTRVRGAHMLNTCALGAGTHGEVLNVHTGSF